MSFQTIRMELQGTVCKIQLHRPKAGQTFNNLLLEECHQALDLCEGKATVIVLEGLPDIYCAGADFREMIESGQGQNPEEMYRLWLRLAKGPFITIAHVRGKVNAGGAGFVAACDIVLADTTASFSLSELLFGLYPACVLPFLIRRIGIQRAHYMTLTTQVISVHKAADWGLVDAFDEDSEQLLRRHLLRLKAVDQAAVTAYKMYINQLDDLLQQSESQAVTENRKLFTNPVNMGRIVRYVQTGKMPWEE